MSNYIGVRCPVCSKKFASADDIVVCPICGAPHHRECYMEKGQCALTEDHSSGKEWQAPPDERPPQSDAGAKACPSCGANNPQESLYCQVCGNRMNMEAQQAGAGQAAYGGFGPFGTSIPFDAQQVFYGGLSPEEEINGQQVKDIALYIGNNAAYFLPKFKKFAAGASALSINFAAFLLSYFYCFYRKLYLVGAVLFALSVLTMLPYLLLLRETMPDLIHTPEYASFMAFIEQNSIPFNPPTHQVDYALANFYAQSFRILRVINICARIALAFLVNRLYFSKCTSSVARIRRDMEGVVDLSSVDTALACKGGANILALVLCGVVLFVSFVVSCNIIFAGIF